jgi:23S rRNA (cytidine1920-2'-O)/16S rRNA (cytidine1409-2'-O)-methyltransferase
MPGSVEKKRLDTLLLERSLVNTRERAKAVIMSGNVSVDGERADKPGKEYRATAEILIKEELPYVGRGGLKLQGALERFEVECHGLRILDAGASTGGFTDCLLKRGAKEVIAVDVGYGQFNWELRQDSRVRVIERCNVRKMQIQDLGAPVQGIVADLSFISLRLVLKRFYDFLESGGWALPMVKPQFEVGKEMIPRGGVVKDRALIDRAVDSVEEFALSAGFSSKGRFDSPIKGPKGNQEVFLYLLKDTGV